MHRNTPWTKQSSSLPSDRIKPATKSQGSSNKNKNNKGNTNSKEGPSRSSSSSRPDSEASKSKEVKKLESLLKALRTSSGLEKDPKGGCYCLARIHDLSPYTPICRSCGLILCSLNQPHYSCPDCLKPLLSTTTTTTSTNISPTRETIIEQVESRLATTVSQEIEDRQRALDETRKAAGAFPALPGHTNSDHHNQQPQQYPIPATQTHKVLSLSGNKNKNNNNNNSRRTVTLSSYTTTHPSRSGSVTPIVNDEPTMIGPPKPPPVSTKRPDPTRPFENFLHGRVSYKPSSA